MDVFLSKVTQQAMNYAIRSGVTLTASYAIKQSTKLLNSAPKSDARDELYRAQQRLQNKIRIVSPAIDMIELIAARGNTSLESAVALTKELRLQIQSLGQRLAKAAEHMEKKASKNGKNVKHLDQQTELELKWMVRDINRLLERIEDAVPLINLAITTSGASLSTSLPHTVSPSRLLQASTFLTAGDTQYALSPQSAVQIGPTFTLTVYMLFAGHDRPQDEEDIRETTWKEVIHKARVKLRRVPLDLVTGTGSGSDATPSAEISSPGPVSDVNGIFPADARADEYAYQMMIIEDFDDDRVHDFEEDQPRPGPFDDVALAGIREMIPIHQISKIFYADTSKVLNIGSDAESNHPVLLLKRDVNAIPPRRMMRKEELSEEDEEGITSPQNQQPEQHYDDELRQRHQDPWRFPPSLDPEWIAFEVYSESDSEESDAETEAGEKEQDEEDTSRTDFGDNYHADDDAAASQLANCMSDMHLSTASTSSPSPSQANQNQAFRTSQSPPWVNGIKTSLSLLELLLRLTSLQQFQQQSHLSITDELLNFFLEESASTGAGGDEHYRQALRAEARRRVGWDPYDESPMKKRGEEYQYYSPSPRSSPAPHRDAQVQGLTGPASSPWNPRDAHMRSITGVSDFQAPSPSPRASLSPRGSPLPSMPPRERSRGSRASWLKREDGRKGSPLRPQTAHTDEGIGTSPASSGIDKA
ncbi:Ran-specific GTPase-activating protein 30 [Exophiala dermatitidis]|uniref:RanGTP-binding protein n=2 Tax=Exophiala dermatitidis TaxID=5970 RepID=H6C3C4_EXODN|nr:uncharacterized protein HMPREF1120_06157 [Exophiala dermatitidis NIH/UT8656]KAJ4517088.1 Ran-specific GTPase-activating protein 30 [Exophiala dermatitidis]EHY58139.1 hypothetical protein HMPREF1120_06157 [Exophiala dermatitidis NIH/UT8656]KAJ4519735.1 Ran-specific GTPase-activating protein 30 [Exophiala dermatitidis]KAJ4534462.1 Ran-specific GTPase-activating protein 30 [Exophiala dermatitidis]KAJ4541316.1 Ran-specific GTPase-activating protein 30 [Exophiala dermatitidis]